MEKNFVDKIIALENAIEVVLGFEEHAGVRSFALCEIIKSEILKYPDPRDELENFINHVKNDTKLCDEEGVRTIDECNGIIDRLRNTVDRCHVVIDKLTYKVKDLQFELAKERCGNPKSCR